MAKKGTKKKRKLGRIDMRGFRPGIVEAARDGMNGIGPHEKNAQLRYAIATLLVLLNHPDCPQDVKNWLAAQGSVINGGGPVPEEFWYEFRDMINDHVK